MPEDFYIGNDWLIQPSLNRISSPQKTMRIPQKYMQVLVCLAERAGEAISREHLMETVWKDTIVVEESLTRAISELRKILDDDPKKSHVIETIPKVGYRLIAPVTQRNGGTREEAKLEFIPSSNGRAAVTSRLGFSRRAKLVAAGIAILLVGGAGWLYFSPSAQPRSAPPTRTQPLTSYQGIESHPALSPDGNKLAFIWDSGASQTQNLYVKAVGSETPLQLTDNSGGYSDPAWSPDGRYIAYIKHAAEGCKIFKISSSGGPEQKVVALEKGVHPLHPAWSPDGKWLAYAVHRNSPALHGIRLFSVASLDSRELTGQQPEVIDDKPIFSPDGKRLAFIRFVAGKKDIFWMRVDGGEARRLTHGQHWITDVDWTPDGRHLVFSSHDGLWKIPAAGGKAELLAAGSMTIENVSVARTNWRLAYEQATEDKNIWQVPISYHETNNALPSLLIGSSRSDADPDISPDGKRIAFVSNRSGNPQIWMSARDGSNAVPLTNFDGCHVGSPNWSPDDRLIAFIANPFGQLDIYIVAVAGGEPERLTTAPANEEAPTWSRDGGWIYFGAKPDGQSQIYKISLAERWVAQVTQQGGSKAIESRDGKLLYYARNVDNITEIRRAPLPFKDGADELVISLRNVSCDDWRVGDDGIYYGYYDYNDDKCNLSIGFVNFHTRETLTLFDRGKSSFNFDVTADGRTLLFEQFDRSESDIVLVENFR